MNKKLVVTAGAGTGKTTRLLDEILSIVTSRRARIERILAITFTESAAAEIKERLRERIERERSLEPELMEVALESLEITQISTIHALASRIVRENPMEVGVDPDFSIIEESTSFLFADEIWELWANMAFWGGNEFDEDLVSLIKHCGVSAVKGIAETIARRPDRIEPYLKSRIDPKPEYERRSREMGRLFADLSKIDLAVTAEDPLAERCVAFLEILSRDSLEEAFHAFKDSHLKRSGGTSKRWENPASFERARAIIDGPDGAIDYMKSLGQFLDVLKRDRLAEKAARVLRHFVEFERQEKKRRGLLSFFDLLWEAYILLRDNHDIRRRYQNEFDYILVDEFQDTDPIQGDIIMFLAEKEPKAESPADVVIKPGKLFIVGDPKQSIYGFRDADLGVFFTATRKILESGGEPDELQNNYRSQRHLVAFQNAFFRTCFPDPDDRYSTPYTTLTPTVDDIIASPTRKSPAVIIVDSTPSDDALSEEVRRREADYIADYIAEMVELGKDGNIIRDKVTKKARRPEYRDIAILFRSLAETAYLYEDSLKRKGIPYYIMGGRGYYQRQEIFDVYHLLKSIYNPMNRGALVAALRSPIFGVDDEKIYALARCNRMNYLLPDPDPSIEKIYSVIRHLHSFARRSLISELIGEIFRSTEILEVNAFGPGGLTRLGNLEKIRRIAAELEGQANLALSSFIRLLRELSQRNIEEGEAAVTEELEDSVRIMTIHKAKGLEFPVVFLPDLGRRFNLGSRDGIVIDAAANDPTVGLHIGPLEDLGYALLLDERIKSSQLAEERRLLYVGTTRARDRLVLLGSTKNKNSHMSKIVEFTESIASRPEPAAEPPFEVIPLPPDGEKKVSYQKRRSPQIDDLLTGPGDRRPLDEITARERSRREELLRREGRRLFSSVTAEKDDAGAHFTSDGDGASSLLVGSIIHDVLERIDFSTKKTADDIFTSLPTEIVPDPALRAEVLSECRDIASRFLSSELFRTIARSVIIGREMPILTQDGETTVSGRVDIVFRTEEAIIVLDYKTDRVAEGKQRDAAERYRDQLVSYIDTLTSALGTDTKVIGGVYFMRIDAVVYF